MDGLEEEKVASPPRAELYSWLDVVLQKRKGDVLESPPKKPRGVDARNHNDMLEKDDFVLPP
jgi:hypothetical protein